MDDPSDLYVGEQPKTTSSHVARHSVDRLPNSQKPNVSAQNQVSSGQQAVKPGHTDVAPERGRSMQSPHRQYPQQPAVQKRSVQHSTIQQTPQRPQGQSHHAQQPQQQIGHSNSQHVQQNTANSNDVSNQQAVPRRNSNPPPPKADAIVSRGNNTQISPTRQQGTLSQNATSQPRRSFPPQSIVNVSQQSQHPTDPSRIVVNQQFRQPAASPSRGVRNQPLHHGVERRPGMLQPHSSRQTMPVYQNQTPRQPNSMQAGFVEHGHQSVPIQQSVPSQHHVSEPTSFPPARASQNGQPRQSSAQPQPRAVSQQQAARHMRTSSVPETPTRIVPQPAQHQGQPSAQQHPKSVGFRATPEYIEPEYQSPVFNSAQFSREQSPMMQPARPPGLQEDLRGAADRSQASATRAPANMSRIGQQALQHNLASSNRFAPQQPSRFPHSQSLHNMHSSSSPRTNPRQKQNSADQNYNMSNNHCDAAYDQVLASLISQHANIGYQQTFYDRNQPEQNALPQDMHYSNTVFDQGQTPSDQHFTTQDHAMHGYQDYNFPSHEPQITPSGPDRVKEIVHNTNNRVDNDQQQYFHELQDVLQDPNQNMQHQQNTLDQSRVDEPEPHGVSMPPPSPKPHRPPLQSQYLQPDEQYQKNTNAIKKRRVQDHPSQPTRPKAPIRSQSAKQCISAVKPKQTVKPVKPAPQARNLDYPIAVLKTKSLSDLQKEPFLEDPKKTTKIADGKKKAEKPLSLEELFGDMWKKDPEQVRINLKSQSERDWEKTGTWLKARQQEDLDRLMAIRLERRKLVLKQQDALRRKQLVIEGHRKHIKDEMRELRDGAAALLTGRWRPSRDGPNPHDAPPAKPEQSTQVKKAAEQSGPSDKTTTLKRKAQKSVQTDKPNQARNSGTVAKKAQASVQSAKSGQADKSAKEDEKAQISTQSEKPGKANDSVGEDQTVKSG